MLIPLLCICYNVKFIPFFCFSFVGHQCVCSIHVCDSVRVCMYAPVYVCICVCKCVCMCICMLAVCVVLASNCGAYPFLLSDS